MQQGQVVIVLIGMISSGKTTWARTHYYNFLRLEGDTLKTSPKIVAALKAALDRGQNVIVDATNVTVERRKDIIDECRRRMIKVYAVVFKIPLDVCMQRRTKREAAKLASGEAVAHIPDVAFYTLNKKYVEPGPAEGFEAIVYVEHNPNDDIAQPLSSGRRPVIKL